MKQKKGSKLWEGWIVVAGAEQHQGRIYSAKFDAEAEARKLGGYIVEGAFVAQSHHRTKPKPRRNRSHDKA